jgi:hypothetical protein
MPLNLDVEREEARLAIERLQSREGHLEAVLVIERLLRVAHLERAAAEACRRLVQEAAKAPWRILAEADALAHPEAQDMTPRHFVCENCGGADIHYLVWFDQRTGEMTNDDCPGEPFFCVSCEANVDVFTEEVEDARPDDSILQPEVRLRLALQANAEIEAEVAHLSAVAEAVGADPLSNLPKHHAAELLRLLESGDDVEDVDKVAVMEAMEALRVRATGPEHGG